MTIPDYLKFDNTVWPTAKVNLCFIFHFIIYVLKRSKRNIYGTYNYNI